MSFLVKKQVTLDMGKKILKSKWGKGKESRGIGEKITKNDIDKP